MGVADDFKAMWNDPKKKPWVIAGAGAAIGAGVLAMRRPVDPEDQVAEETAATIGTAAATEAYPDEYVYGGTLPPVYALGGAGYDAGLAETDLSSVFDELDRLGASFEDALGERTRAINQRMKMQAKRQRKQTNKTRERLEKQAKINRAQRKQILKMKQRAKKGPKRKPRDKKNKAA
jgi:hypothetical protein